MLTGLLHVTVPSVLIIVALCQVQMSIIPCPKCLVRNEKGINCLDTLVAQMVKNLPALWKTWVPFLGWEDPLEEDMGTHSSILAWRIPMDRGGWWATVHGVTKVGHDLVTKRPPLYYYISFIVFFKNN